MKTAQLKDTAVQKPTEDNKLDQKIQSFSTGIMSLKGMVALVTGGAQGIGRSVVQSLMQCSAKVSTSTCTSNISCCLFTDGSSVLTPITFSLAQLEWTDPTEHHLNLLTVSVTAIKLGFL